MTTNDNSTSPPWLQAHGLDTAADKDDSPTKHVPDDQVDESVAAAKAEPAGSEAAERDSAPEADQQVSGIFPPVPESMEQPGFAPGPPYGQEQFPPHEQFPPQDQFGQFAPPGGGFAPPGFVPPGAPYPPNQGFAPPGAFPMPGEQGQFPGGPGEFMPGNPNEPGHFAPPGEHGQFPPHGDPNQFPPQGDPNQFPPPGEHGQFAPPPPYGEMRQETPYGEVRQEIGADGMVRRIFAEDSAPPPPPPGPEQAGGGQEQYSWAPPPLPPQQPMYQPPQPPPHSQGPGVQQGPGGWQGGPNQPPQQPMPGFQPQHMQQPGPAHSVNDLNLLKRARRSPRSGWRRAVHKMSGGAINPGESSADVVYRELVDRVNQPVRGDYRIAILSLKGGVGKTTTTVGLGSTFSSLRGDRVIAIDANPDLGTLAHRVPRQTRSTVRNLLEDQHISRYSDVRAHTSQAPSRLEVLASEQDPAVSEAFSEADYRRAISTLQQFYNIILTDCGTGLMHSAMAGVLDLASSLVLVTSPAIDGARSASATLDWLEHHGYGKLVERTVVVVNASRRGASTVDLDQLRKLFLDRTRAVQVVPFDDHLAEGAEIDLELVSKPTKRALLELAAMVADDFGYHVPQPPFPGPQTQYPGPQGGYPGQYPG
ncbi:AAA family ATPase [Nocardia terpenica]|nr:AAA family ATPase [Nocardia terpenica]